jgi:acetyl-CoA carboxylase biotin carboxyl carrier protein
MMDGHPEEADVERVIDPVAVGPGDDGPAADSAGAADTAPNGGTAGTAGAAEASLLALVDRLAGVLERSDLGELEIAAGATTIVLRAPAALERPIALAPPAGAPPDAPAAPAAQAPTQPAAADAPAARPSVKAPLTGIYYSAPSPGATPYVRVGDQVAVGQLIGLIEAMKLFNEIKSDRAGRVVRVCVENGALVKAKQPLIEVEPL